ncbi:hypothetical protein OH77DRAFT_642061 [Trametes cingulata]|nr:hypothetical protein OH77DRAFT_642061 [Trametes cingulata]
MCANWPCSNKPRLSSSASSGPIPLSSHTKLSVSYPDDAASPFWRLHHARRRPYAIRTEALNARRQARVLPSIAPRHVRILALLVIQHGYLTRIFLDIYCRSATLLPALCREHFRNPQHLTEPFLSARAIVLTFLFGQCGTHCGRAARRAQEKQHRSFELRSTDIHPV